MTEKKKFEDGVYDISNEEYHGSEGLSRSQIILMDKSPYHFWFGAISGLSTKKEATDALNIGAAFHTILLEPDLFKEEYAVMPKIDRRTTKGKEDYALFTENNGHKIVLTQEQYDTVYTMAYHVKQHDIVHTLIGDAQFERSIFWTDKETGLQFKARPDIWSNKMVVDLKTSKDAAPGMFINSAYRYGYYLQCGMFFEACESIGRPIEMFVNLVIEKEEPYVPATFIMDEKAIDFGREQFRIYKNRIKECMDTENWPGYAVQEISIPKYATINTEEE